MDQETIDELTQLSRIRCTKEEKEKLRENLSSILSHIEALNNVDTDNVQTCYQVYPFSQSVLAEDQEGETIPLDKFFENAPDQVGGMIKTPEVIAF